MPAPLTSDCARAAEILRGGGLVAFPTETVYGLGASARREAAVARIFTAKGRPAHHPLIVHLGQASQLGAWAREVPASARLLAEAFWPGPLTLILERARGVLDAVTGGQATVGLRVPSHPVALELLRLFGDGVAAPSANRFGRVSPTRAEHVLEELGAEVDLVLEGGPAEVGVESTIVDCSGPEPAILRPGGVTREMLESVLGRPVFEREAGEVRAPGQLPSHYAPRAQVQIVEPGEVARQARVLCEAGHRVGVLAVAFPDLPSEVVRLPLGPSLEDGARSLYGQLRRADAENLDVLLVVLPPEVGVGRAIADRLRRAAAPRHQLR